MPIEAQREGVEAARRAGVAVSIDPHEEEVVPGREILAAIVADSIFVPSELEVALLFPDLAEAHAGLELARAALPRLAEWRPRAVAIKLGAAGSLVWEADTPCDAVHVPALPVTVVDAIGAGDAYCGGFAAAWLATGSAVAAAACGSVAAARVIGQFGAFPPTWPEPVESLLDDARSLLRSSADERAAIDALDVMSEHRDAAAMAARR
jgi:sugar/nucleoside kinase (ribokinase family)